MQVRIFNFQIPVLPPTWLIIFLFLTLLPSYSRTNVYPLQISTQYKATVQVIFYFLHAYNLIIWLLIGPLKGSSFPLPLFCHGFKVQLVVNSIPFLGQELLFWDYHLVTYITWLRPAAVIGHHYTVSFISQTTLRRVWPKYSLWSQPQCNICWSAIELKG
jgi:hypothetical protein